MDDSTDARAHTLIQQTLLGDAAEHAEIGLLVWNEERRYVAVNRFACEILGVSREALLGAKVGDQNPTAAARDAIEESLEELPAFGRTPLPNGKTVDWITVASDVAGLPHIVGVMWEARASGDEHGESTARN
jgi:PAS domain-containing protein